MDVRLAVVSDLHCHPSTDKPWDSFLHCDALRSPAKQHPVESLLALIREQNLTADVLLAPGDLANKINVQGFQSAWPFIREIGAALKVNAIAAAVGNHDVDSRKMHNGDPFHIPKSIYSDYPVGVQADRDRFWQHGYYFVELPQIRILIVNSVISHFDELSATRGSISPEHLEGIKQALHSLPPKPFQIALMHHHPHPHEDLGLGSDDLMVNGSLLVDALATNKFHLIVHGHKHHPKISYAQGGTSSPVVFASGSLSAFLGTGATNTRNLFHLITLSGSTVVGCSNSGKIETWEFSWGDGWDSPTAKSAGIASITGFGCRETAETLAGETAAWFTGLNTKFAGWPELLTAFPKMQFMAPRDFLEYGNLLISKHGIKLAPSPPELPEVIGFSFPRN